MTDDPGRLVDDEQLLAALGALGLREVRSTDPQAPVEYGFLLGALLALTEYFVAAAPLVGADRTVVRGGYRWALDQLAHHDTPTAARTWALLLQDRLNRTADELQTVGATGQSLVAVAGPAALAGANVLSLLHHTAASPSLVATSVGTAEANLATAAGALDRLRAELRSAGFEL